MTTRNRRTAFSLLELLAVVTILGIIAAVVLPRMSGASDLAKRKLNAHNKAVINSAVERYYLENGVWPSANLVELSPSYFPDGIPVTPHDGTTAYTVSTGTHRVDNNPDPP